MWKLYAPHLLLAFLYPIWAFIGTSAWRWLPGTLGPRVMCAFVWEQPSNVSLVPSMAPCSIPLRPESWRTSEHLGWDCHHLEKYMGLLKFLSLVHPQRTLGTPRWEKMKPDNHQRLLCTDGFNFLHPWRKRKRRTGWVFEDLVVLLSTYECGLRFLPLNSFQSLYAFEVQVFVYFLIQQLLVKHLLRTNIVLGLRDRSVEKTDRSSCIEKKKSSSIGTCDLMYCHFFLFFSL